jgi:hypothetical protein
MACLDLRGFVPCISVNHRDPFFAGNAGSSFGGQLPAAHGQESGLFSCLQPWLIWLGRLVLKFGFAEGDRRGLASINSGIMV